MKKTNFEQLLKLYLMGELTEQEKIKIETWLEVVHIKDAPKSDLTQEEEEALFKKNIDKRDNLKEIKSFPDDHNGNSGGWPLRAAISLLVIVLVSYAGWCMGNRSSHLEIASQGGVEKVILTDGSLVWLRGQSKLLYYNRASEGTRCYRQH